jgi:alkylation response protein AidB-like acyl-CoA dehydrogenase
MQWNSLRLMTTLKTDQASAVTQASISKVYASGSHQRLGELSMSILGAQSELVTPEYGLSGPQETFLASRAESIYGGTTQVQLNILAERSLGLPREPSAR